MVLVTSCEYASVSESRMGSSMLFAGEIRLAIFETFPVSGCPRMAPVTSQISGQRRCMTAIQLLLNPVSMLE